MDSSDALRSEWDQRHRANDRPLQPAAVLADNTHLLPQRATVLDLACGRGANALFLADIGLSVSAWDLSPVAVERLETEATARGLTIDTQVRDVIAIPPEPMSFDVIVVAHFLDRALAPDIVEALRPGGLVFYQTFSRDSVTCQGPSNPDYRLAPNELLRLFSGLLVRVYREEGRLGDTSRGFRDLAQLVGERPV